MVQQLQANGHFGLSPAQALLRARRTPSQMTEESLRLRRARQRRCFDTALLVLFAAEVLPRSLRWGRFFLARTLA